MNFMICICTWVEWIFPLQWKNMISFTSPIEIDRILQHFSRPVRWFSFKFSKSSAHHFVSKKNSPFLCPNLLVTKHHPNCTCAAARYAVLRAALLAPVKRGLNGWFSPFPCLGWRKMNLTNEHLPQKSRISQGTPKRSTKTEVFSVFWDLQSCTALNV